MGSGLGFGHPSGEFNCSFHSPSCSSVEEMVRKDIEDLEGVTARVPEENRWCTQKGLSWRESNRAP